MVLYEELRGKVSVPRSLRRNPKSEELEIWPKSRQRAESSRLRRGRKAKAVCSPGGKVLCRCLEQPGVWMDPLFCRAVEMKAVKMGTGHLSKEAELGVSSLK